MIFEILYFGILTDNHHTNIQNTTRLNIIKIIFYQQPKLPSLITKKKWWKFFCDDQLERIFISSCSDSLPSRTIFGHRIWVETLNYPRFKERWPWVHLSGRSVVSGPTLTHCPSQTPIIFNFHAIWTSTLFLSEQVQKKRFLPRFRSSFAEPSIAVKISEFGRPSED
jgi:hypothetical protein